MTGKRSGNLEPALTLAWLPLLLALQSIPGTGALRTLLLLIGIAHIVWWWLRHPPPAGSVAVGRVEVWIFMALTAWLLFQSAFLSPLPGAALKQLAGEWTKLMLMGAIGIILARLHGATQQRWLIAALFAAFFLHVLSTLGQQIVTLAGNGSLVFGDSLLGNYGYVSPFTTAAFAWLLADGASRMWHARPLLPWSAGVTLAMGLAALGAEMLLRAKSGHVMIAILTSVVIVAFALRHGVQRRGVMLALIGVAVIALALTGSERWHGGAEAAMAAWQGPIDSETLTGYSAPQTPSSQLEQSFYLRMTWARIALEGIAAHPWGLGYGTDAFGRYVAERFGITGAISSHSGWLDFALANGIVGLALWLALAGALIWRGWRAFIAGQLIGAALALLMLHQVGRALIDGVLFGSRFTGFALVMGALWFMSLRKPDAPGSS